jgi:uncharacterized protein
MAEKLLIFTRYPEAGKTKTRLIPLLGAEGAAQWQRKMTESTIEECRKLQDLRGISIEVYYHGGSIELMQSWLGCQLTYQPQLAGDLGVKMSGAFDRAFESGCDRIMIIGTDCPQLTAVILERGFDSLKTNDLVLGEATDGGYYAIGLSRYIPDLFSDIPWGTATVAQKTQNIAKQLDLSIAYLPVLNDVDRPEDLSSRGVWGAIRPPP